MTVAAVTEADGAAKPESRDAANEKPGRKRGLLGSVAYVVCWTPSYLRWKPDVPYELSWRLCALFALVAGFEVANLAYTHPILHLLAENFHVTDERASLAPTMAQSGYAVGLLFICPAGDVLPPRPLMLFLIFITAMFWLGCTLASSFNAFVGLQFLVGVTTVTPQLLFPLVVRYASARHRPTMTAVTMSGLTFGILLARLISGIIAEFAGWRIVFWVSFGLQMSLFIPLIVSLPDFPTVSPPGTSYPRILLKMVVMLFRHPVLMQQAAIGFMTMAMFTSFWTTLTFQLHDVFHLSTLVIGLFALIGLSPVVVSPIISRVAMGRIHPAGMLVLSHVCQIAVLSVGTFVGNFSLAGLVIWASLGDLFMSTVVVSNRLSITGVDPTAQSTVNAVYMTCSFCGQLFGTAMGNKLYARGGWIHSGAFSIGLIGLGLLLTLVRGPHEKGWIGWRGGWEVRFSKLAVTASQGTPAVAPQDEEAAADGAEGSEKTSERKADK